MEKIPCDVAGDLLPMYAEDMLSPGSRALVETHLAGCPACQAKLGQLKTPLPRPQSMEEDAAPLRKLRRRLNRQRWGTAALAGLLAAAALVLAFVHLTAPIPLSYEDGLVQVEELEDGTVVAVLGSQVAGWQATRVQGPGGGQASHLTVWDSLWNRWRGGQPRAAVLSGPAEGVQAVYFYSAAPGAAQPDLLIWGQPGNDEQGGGAFTLPRLALGPYALLAAAALLGCAVLSLTARRGAHRRRWAARAALVPAAYLAAQLCTKGFTLASYTLVKDLSGILLAALPAFGLLWWAQTWLWRRKGQLEP